MLSIQFCQLVNLASLTQLLHQIHGGKTHVIQRKEFCHLEYATWIRHKTIW